MKRIILYSGILIAVFQLFSSCSDFLDHAPDNRVELTTPEQMSLVLVDGYSKGNCALLAELSSDNLIDNNSPDENGIRYDLQAYNKIDDEVFAWEDAVSGDEEDSPSFVWENAYHAIAVANHVLESIEKLKEEGRGSEVRAQEGEALLIRAYNHFVLVNVFAHAYKNEEISAVEKGIPYVTKPETVVQVQYERLSVAEVYKKIEEDFLAGIDKIDDSAYDVPKYHFNKKAACAFAARFYLFKRQYEEVLKWANAAFGGENADPSAYMRDWSQSYSNFSAIVQGYINAASANNFLIIATNSTFERSYSSNTRYGCNRGAASATLYGEGPTWPSSVTGYRIHPCYLGKLYINGSSQEYGLFFPKAGEMFEFTDKIARTGFTHVVRCEFTGEETLLCRAEAKIFLGDIDGAVNDLRIWDNSRQNITIQTSFLTLNRQLIEKFYTADKKEIVKPLNIDKIAPSDIYKMTPAMEPYLQCVLHFRRIETIFDGYRWFDIKRYGIEIEHKIGQKRVETLTFDDPRRALQMPAEVIAAGMAPNVRTKVSTERSEPQKLNASFYKNDK